VLSIGGWVLVLLFIEVVSGSASGCYSDRFHFLSLMLLCHKPTDLTFAGPDAFLIRLVFSMPTLQGVLLPSHLSNIAERAIYF
jgi:hypothetical protein